MAGYLKNRLSNKENKKLVENFSWLVLLQAASYVFPLITMPYLARTIGVTGFGKIAFATAIISWLIILTDWGFHMTATRDVAQNRDDTNKVSIIFSRVICAQFILMLISLIIVLILIFTVPKFNKEWEVIIATFLTIPGHILFPSWMFQALERMKFISLLNILTKLFFTISIFIFIKSPDDYIYQPILTSFGYILSGLISIYIITKKWGYKLFIPKFKDIINIISSSFDVFINKLAPNLYLSFTTIILGFCGGEIANGIYSGGNKFSGIGNNVLHTFTRTFFPYLSRKPEKHRKFMIMTMSVSICVSGILFFCAPWIIRTFLSPEFENSIAVLRILSISLIFMALSNVYGSCYLIIHKRERELRRVTLFSSIVGLILAFPLIYKFSYIGAAITVLISRFLLGSTSAFTALCIKHKKTCE